VLLGDSLGFLWGVASGYLGGRVDLISQRALDVLMSLPALILALLLMAALGAGLSTVIIAIAVTRVPLSTRVVRSMVLSVKELAYVEAAGALGASGARVMTRHVAPQCVAPFLIITTGHLGAAIFIEAALSFVGVGIPPPTPSWGNILSEGRQYIKCCPWITTFSGLAIMVAVLAFNLVGDALRDLLDPRLKGE
jgi:ABC-type dipeptide/oligopeptide/nickel transport system permease subunit